jgi:polysaccharide export outer membrane protein
MTKPFRILLCALAALATSACEHGQSSHLPQGEAAYQAISLKAHQMSEDEVVHENDRLSIRVVGEPELTSDAYRVDGNGTIEVPLAGDIQAAGRSPLQIRDEITTRLAARYIRNPQVAVIVFERAKSTFSVEGAVREPGTYDVTPDSTLLSALAMAKSPTNVARLSGVMVFRKINGQRMGARFNLIDIRNGRADDPQILAGDTVVVVHSDAKAAWHEILQAAPLATVFYYLR